MIAEYEEVFSFRRNTDSDEAWCDIVRNTVPDRGQEHCSNFQTVVPAIAYLQPSMTRQTNVKRILDDDRSTLITATNIANWGVFDTSYLTPVAAPSMGWVSLAPPQKKMPPVSLPNGLQAFTFLRCRLFG